MGDLLTRAGEIFLRGGPVMWPLLALSVISVMLTVERTFYWILTHRPGRRAWVRRLADRLRKGDHPGARAIIAKDNSLYGEVAAALLDAGGDPSAALQVGESRRPSFERFSATLSTIITAAPLLGILGTVLGIIRSFDLLGAGQAVTDIGAVAAGIAEALITTAFGLIVALITLFPYMVFRAQAERCIGMIELLAAAADQSRKARATDPRP